MRDRARASADRRWRGQVPAEPLAVAAERIRRLRAKARLSQEAFGARIGVAGAKVGHWEQGERGLPVRDAIAICAAFRVTLDWIYGRRS